MASQYDVSGVAKFFERGSGTVRALDGVDLEIERGEFLALEGPSGSGKTTLLQLLGALDRPSEGTVLFEGRDLAKLPDNQLAALRLRSFGFVFQQFNLIPTLTAVENVEVKLAPVGGGREKALQMLGEVGLAERADHLPAHLSGGEQQRVAIAAAAAREAPLVLADEPTAELDEANETVVLRAMRQLRDEFGSTVLVITHSPRVAEAVDRVLELRDGTLV
jgi:putative ABC transport system ATP-binding protein